MRQTVFVVLVWLLSTLEVVEQMMTVSLPKSLRVHPRSLVSCIKKSPTLSSSISSPSSSLLADAVDIPQVTKVAVVGGGLAGLSTAYHLLEQSNGQCHVVVFDQSDVGMGGASSVAGGLIHPLSPRGKLVHWGLEGLCETNKLIDLAVAASARHANDNNNNNDKLDTIVLRDEIFRLAMTKRNADQLQKTARELPEYCEWLDPYRIQDRLRNKYFVTTTNKNNNTTLDNDDGDGDGDDRGDEISNKYLGALRLYNGCKIVHVPSYLRGLWLSCQQLALDNDGPRPQWIVVPPPTNECNGDDVETTGSESKQHDAVANATLTTTAAAMPWKQRLEEYDAVVLAAGSGLFHSHLLSKDSLPIQLVRGQCVEVTLPPPRHRDTDNDVGNGGSVYDAIICGNYVLPLPGEDKEDRVLVGATHEFKARPLTKEQVVEEMKDKTVNMVPRVWNEGSYDRWLSGYRVQSDRGKYGRLPMIGRLLSDPSSPSLSDTTSSSERRQATKELHPNVWLYTGLSSRGLLYHGLFGKILANAVLRDDENPMLSHFPDMTWWRK